MRINDLTRLERLGVVLPVEMVEAIDQAQDLLDDHRPPKPTKPAWDAAAEDVTAYLVAEYRHAHYQRNATAAQSKANKVLLDAFAANKQSMVDAVAERLTALGAAGTYNIEDKAAFERLFPVLERWVSSHVDHADVPTVRASLAYDARYNTYRAANERVTRVQLADIRTAQLYFPSAPEGATLNRPVTYEDGLRLGAVQVDLEDVTQAAKAFAQATAQALAAKNIQWASKAMSGIVAAQAEGRNAGVSQLREL